MSQEQRRQRAFLAIPDRKSRTVKVGGIQSTDMKGLHRSGVSTNGTRMPTFTLLDAVRRLLTSSGFQVPQRSLQSTTISSWDTSKLNSASFEPIWTRSCLEECNCTAHIHRNPWKLREDLLAGTQGLSLRSVPVSQKACTSTNGGGVLLQNMDVARMYLSLQIVTVRHSYINSSKNKSQIFPRENSLLQRKFTFWIGFLMAWDWITVSH